MSNLPNPNRPLAVFEVNFQAGPPSLAGSQRVSINQPANRCYVRQWDTQRGRQYELDQVQAGMATLIMVDPNEDLNPLNTASPYNSGGNTITAYRCLNVAAYWPVTGNMYNPNVNPAYDGSFETTGSNAPFGAPGGGSAALSTAQALFGTKSLLVTQAGNVPSQYAIVTIPGVPGVTATVSVYAYLTGGCSLQIQCPDGTTSAVLATQTTWTRITVTYTQVDARDVLTFAGTVAGTPAYYLDGFQVEWANSASTFTTTGPTKNQIYNGYVERYPTSYDMSGTRALRPLQAVDALSMLSRTNISQSYLSTISTDGPQLYLPLSDTAPPGRFAIGGVGLLPIPSPSAAGTFNWAGDAFLDGSSALVMSQKNAFNPPAPGGSGQDTEWNITQGVFSVNTAAATFETWAKFVQGNATVFQVAVISDGKTIFPDQQIIDLSGGFTGNVRAYIGDIYSGASSSFNLPASWNGFADDQWHYLAVTLSPSGVVTITCDGQEESHTLSPALGANWGVNNIHFDVNTGLGDPFSQISVCNWSYYTRDIGSTVRQNHYNRGVGYINELSGVRVRRLLNQYWGGPTSIANGYLKMAPDFSYNGRTMLDVLQEIQESERGLLYVDRNGTVVFEDRTSRYQNQVPVAVFGENPPGASPAEFPYIEYAADFDPTYTFTQANLSRPANDNFAPVVNATSQAKYGQRILTQTVQCNTDFDLAQAATFYLNRYADPKVRISTLTLSPASNPDLWPVVLGLEISQRVTVKRRTAALTTSNDYYVEQIHHKADAETGDWTVTLQLSPVFVNTAWVLGSAAYGVLGTETVPVY
jgi:hypothetical protein